MTRESAVQINHILTDIEDMETICRDFDEFVNDHSYYSNINDLYSRIWTILTAEKQKHEKLLENFKEGGET